MKSRLIWIAVVASLVGCQAAIQKLTRGRRVEKAQQEKYDREVTKPFREAEAATKDGLPDNLEDLREAYWVWTKAYDFAESFYTSDHAGSETVGTCDTGERKGNKLCQDARKAQAAAAKQIAAILHAAIELDPEPAMSFPAGALTETQTHSTIAKKVKVGDSATRLVEKWESYWSKRLKKAGSARELVRKEGKGMCFFSDAPHGKDIKPKVIFAAETDTIYVHCVATDPLRSYDRSQNDVIYLQLIGVHTDRGDNFYEVKKFPIAEISATETMDFEFSTSLLEKTIKAKFLKKGKQYYKDWAYYAIDVQYTVGNKIGVERESRGHNDIHLVDKINYKTVAHGIALVQVGKARSRGDDGEAEASRAGDDDAEVATPAKSKAADKEHEAEVKPKKKKKAKKDSDG